MEVNMEKCVVCADHAQERKYFLKGKPLCWMHYAEYMEVLYEEKDYDPSVEDMSSAFNQYLLTLEPAPLTAEERAEKEKREQVWEEENSYEPDYSPSPYGMGM
jgi:hypothetical protein